MFHDGPWFQYHVHCFWDHYLILLNTVKILTDNGTNALSAAKFVVVIYYT